MTAIEITALPARPFLRREIDALGISDRQLRDLLACQLIRRVLRSVYCRNDLPDTVELRAQAASLVLSEHVVVSDRAASWLHGIDAYDYAELDELPPLEVVSIGGHDRTRRDGTLGGKRALLPDEICEVHGVSVTTPLRTCCDLACLRGRTAALAVLDAYRRAFGLTIDDLNRMLRRFRRRRGVKQLRELIPLSDPERESMGESWTAMTIHDAGISMPRPQIRVLLPELGWVRLDMGFEHLRIAIEYDGEEFHTSAEDRAADRDRREALERAGWIVIVVTKADFTEEASQVWLDELRAAIRERTRAAKRVYSRGESWGLHHR